MEEKKVVLVRASTSEFVRKDDVRTYREYEFYRVDLERDTYTAVPKCCPSLLNDGADGVMVLLGSVIYFFGEQRGKHDDSPDSIVREQKTIACLKGASWIDLSQWRGQWKSAPTPNHSPFFPFCVPLCGKIYCLGNSMIPEVYDLNTNGGSNQPKWVRLPPPPAELVDCSVSLPPIPDPLNRRILVQLCGGKLSSPSIYAFYPGDADGDGGSRSRSRPRCRWECLSSGFNFHYWGTSSALVDGVIFTPVVGVKDLLFAYDLATNQLLNVVWSSRFPENLTRLEFDAVLYFGDGLLCLARFAPSSVSVMTRIYFFLFTFKRSTDAAVITFTPLYSRKYELPGTVEVYDFLPLEE